jgi:hypothetical protein
MPATLEMLMIVPPSSWSRMTAAARWLNTRTPVRLIAAIAAKNRGDAVAVSAPGEPPALLTRTSTRPNSLLHRSTTAWICSSSRTSQAMWTMRLSTPSRPSAAGGISYSARREHVTTFAPSRRNVAAISLPIPTLPPVTIATLSVTSNLPMPVPL